MVFPSGPPLHRRATAQRQFHISHCSRSVRAYFCYVPHASVGDSVLDVELQQRERFAPAGAAADEPGASLVAVLVAALVDADDRAALLLEEVELNGSRLGVRAVAVPTEDEALRCDGLDDLAAVLDGDPLRAPAAPAEVHDPAGLGDDF